jgi:hypothetical protein
MLDKKRLKKPCVYYKIDEYYEHFAIQGGISHDFSR